MRVIVKFVFFQVRIIDVTFLILIMTFLEKFCLLCSLFHIEIYVIVNCAKIGVVH